MNEIALKGILKLVKNMIPPASIREAATAIIKTAIEYKNSIEIFPDKGEATTTGIIYEVDNIIYVSFAVLNFDNQITRFVMVRPLTEVIDQLIEKL